MNSNNPQALKAKHLDRKYWIEIYLAWSIVLTATSLLAFYIAIEYLQIDSSLSALWLSPSGDSAFEYRNPVIGIHSFSDLILHMMYAASSSPYIAPSAANIWGTPIDGSLPASNYPPFAHLFMLPISLLTYDTSVIMLSLATISMMVLPIFFTIRGISLPTIVSVLVAGFIFSYPMLMALDRGNLQGITTGFCLVALRLFLSKRYAFSAVMFGFAAGLKIYPILFMFLFVKQKHFKEFFIGCLTSVVLTGLALVSFKGSIRENVDGFLGALGTFTKVTADGYFLIPNNHSPAALITFLTTNSSASLEKFSLSILTHYSLIMFVLFMALIVLGSFTTKMKENQLLLLICVSIAVIPMVVYGYALSVFFMVLMHLFDNDTKLGNYKRVYVQGTIGLIAILFMAKGIGVTDESSVTIRTFIDPLLLVALAALALWRFRDNASLSHKRGTR